MADNTSVTVTDQPTVVYQNDGPNAHQCIIDNAGAGTITLGGSTVVAGHGPQLAASAQSVPLTLVEDVIYAVCPTGQTATVYVASWIALR